MDYLPTADVLLDLEPEDLGAVLLDFVHRNPQARYALPNVEIPLWNANSPHYPEQKRRAVSRALMEAWNWLQIEGLMMADPDQPNGGFASHEGASVSRVLSM
jgi:hypothetical protein